MELIIAGSLPQTRQTWRGKPVRELFAEIVAKNPDVSEEKLRKLFREAANADDEYLDAIIDYAFDAAFRAYQNQQGREPASARQKASLAERKAAAAKEHAERVEYVKQQIILLNQEMPNGQRARNCTLDYMYRLGGAYRKIGKAGVRKLVGTVYNEEQYRKKLHGLA